MEILYELHRWNAGKKSVLASEKYKTTDVFNPEQRTKSNGQRAERPDIMLSWVLARQTGPNSSELRSREKSKCTKLTHIKSEYDTRRKKKGIWLNILSQLYASLKAPWRYRIPVVPSLSDSLSFMQLFWIFCNNERTIIFLYISVIMFSFLYPTGRSERLLLCFNNSEILSISIFTNPSAQTGYDTRSIFKWSLTGLNSEFSFS